MWPMFILQFKFRLSITQAAEDVTLITDIMTVIKVPSRVTHAKYHKMILWYLACVTLLGTFITVIFRLSYYLARFGGF
jgi:hypothetical protein